MDGLDPGLLLLLLDDGGDAREPRWPVLLPLPAEEEEEVPFLELGGEDNLSRLNRFCPCPPDTAAGLAFILFNVANRATFASAASAAETSAAQY